MRADAKLSPPTHRPPGLATQGMSRRQALHWLALEAGAPADVQIPRPADG
jgi:hypothetical protein